MLAVYTPRGSALVRKQVEADIALPENALWIDLELPTPSEDKAVEDALGISVPTLREMQEIEITSRLYVENGARYMTATLMAHQDTEVPTTTPVTFILAGHRLITVRYDEPRPFVIVNHRLERACPVNATGETIMMDILDAVIDRLADVLEHMGNDVEQVSRDIFDPKAPAGDFNNYSRILHTIGKKGDVTSKVRESLVSIGRVLLYLANEADSRPVAQDYSILTLALLTSWTQNLPSSTRNEANCSGVADSDTSVPSRASAALIGACCMAAMVAS